MPSNVTNYQCPACTGPLHFVGESGKLECDYCGSTYTVEYIESLFKEKNDSAAQAQQNKTELEGEWDFATHTDWDANMKAYSCPSCGAELICDETTAATSCPYCGNPTVIPGQFTGGIKPDYILPFKLSKDKAIDALKQHYKGKKLLPRVFSEQNHLEEIKGIYVPFWLYDATGEGDVQYTAQNVRTFRRGDYEITETDHYRVRRAGSVRFERIPADGSSKMPDEYMDSIEPFDYSELKPFSPAYLPGYLADKYDLDKNQCADRADRRATASVLDVMRHTISGYEMVNEVHHDVNIKRGKIGYALMPVWLLTTRWNDNVYLFAMNGQTGKMVGNLPVDKGKRWRYFFGVFAGAAVVLNLLVNFFG